MREAGVGQMADVLFFAFMVAFGSSLLVVASSVELGGSTRGYATGLARSTLLSLQQATIDELGELSYHPSLQVSWDSEFRLRHKTPAQLILEDALLNPQVDGQRAVVGSNQEFDESVRNLLRDALGRPVGGSFGYRLAARVMPVELSSGATLRFDMVVEDFDEDSGQLCSESVSMVLPAPEWWLDAQLEGAGEENALPRPVATITLELWSR